MMSLNINLDRFSRSMPWENESCSFEDSNKEEMHVCCGCGIEIDFDEPKVESEIYADEFIHDAEDCISEYYKKIGQEPCPAQAKFQEVV